eukprot:GHVH01007040.1.p1 GENE.GHVH01007040.1~~GHVH01007040.1.p1  ORF type:complete len:140 (+),score=5.10 GHVH01007040.1:99-518(+)
MLSYRMARRQAVWVAGLVTFGVILFWYCFVGADPLYRLTHGSDSPLSLDPSEFHRLFGVFDWAIGTLITFVPLLIFYLFLMLFSRPSSYSSSFQDLSTFSRSFEDELNGSLSIAQREFTNSSRASSEASWCGNRKFESI